MEAIRQRRYGNMLVIRMRHKEKEIFDEFCCAAGMSMSEVVRGLIAVWLEVQDGADIQGVEGSEGVAGGD